MSKLESLQPTWNAAKGDLFVENGATMTVDTSLDIETNVPG